MRALIWYETAFIFGCLSPLLVVLLAVQLYADAIGFEWRLSRAPSVTMASWWGAEPFAIRPVVLRAHMVLVLFLQCSSVVYFFVDNQLHGWEMVAVVVPTIFVGDQLVSVLMVWRRRQLQRRASSNTARNPKMPRRQPSSRRHKIPLFTRSSSETAAQVVSKVGGISTESPMHPWGGEYLDRDSSRGGARNEDRDEEEAL